MDNNIWYKNYIDYMLSQGLYNIYDQDTDFNNVIKREEVVYVINKLTGIKVDKNFIDRHRGNLKTFSDVDEKNSYYYDIISASNTFTFQEMWIDYYNINTLSWSGDSYQNAKNPQSFKYYLNN